MVNGVLEQDAINIITYRYLSVAYRIWDIMLNIKLYGFYISYVICEPEACIPFSHLNRLGTFLMLNL
jgi:hypothetical protein